jgi:PGF-pre-PGF domain-containing protein
VGSSNGERTITVSGVVAGATVSLYKSGSFVTSQYTPNGGTVVFSRLILGNGYRAVQSISGINSLPSSVVSVEAATNNNTNSGSNTGSSGSSDSNSGSDSSSSVGAGVSPEPQSNVEAKELSQTSITYGNSVNFNFPQNATPVTNISFDSKKTVGKTTAIVEMLINQSTLVSEPPSDEVYKFVNIWVGNSGVATPDNIENATVYFKVEKSWLQDKNIDQSSIAFNMYNDSKWNSLKTTLAGEDGKYLYFTAETPGLSSPFVITGKTASNATLNETKSETQSGSNSSLENNASNATNVKQAQSSNISESEGKKSPGFESVFGILENNASNATNVKQTQRPSTSENESKKSPGFGSVFGIVSLLAVFLYKRK